MNPDTHLINLIEGESPDLVPREPRTYPYRILGDDIVIFDKRLATIYQDTMKRLGCPIFIGQNFQFKGNGGVCWLHDYCLKGSNQAW